MSQFQNAPFCLPPIFVPNGSVEFLNKWTDNFWLVWIVGRNFRLGICVTIGNLVIFKIWTGYMAHGKCSTKILHNKFVLSDSKGGRICTNSSSFSSNRTPGGRLKRVLAFSGRRLVRLWIWECQWQIAGGGWYSLARSRCACGCELHRNSQSIIW